VNVFSAKTLSAHGSSELAIDGAASLAATAKSYFQTSYSSSVSASTILVSASTKAALQATSGDVLIRSKGSVTALQSPRMQLHANAQDMSLLSTGSSSYKSLNTVAMRGNAGVLLHSSQAVGMSARDRVSVTANNGALEVSAHSGTAVTAGHSAMVEAAGALRIATGSGDFILNSTNGSMSQLRTLTWPR
jgi:hypothetical protein